MIRYQSIQNRIYILRGVRVMLDRDLAALYGVSTKQLNLAVKRNKERFPEDFIFKLLPFEYDGLKPEIQQIMGNESLRFQIETSNKRGGNRYLPHAFTEQGISMLSAVLNSPKAIQMSIAIIRVFVELRRLSLQPQYAEEIKSIMDRINSQDMQISQIQEALENLLDEKAAQRRWEERERIGFKGE